MEKGRFTEYSDKAVLDNIRCYSGRVYRISLLSFPFPFFNQYHDRRFRYVYHIRKVYP